MMSSNRWAMTMRYRIEQRNGGGDWCILAWELSRDEAEYHIGRYRALYPNSEFRVVPCPKK